MQFLSNNVYDILEMYCWKYIPYGKYWPQKSIIVPKIMV